MDLSAAQIVFLAAVVMFTMLTAWTDLRTRRIPNRITVPMCVAGLLWQATFHGLSGIGNGLLGFLVGFGILFLLWMVGSAGGGDVKLLGALSVWLGPRLTLYVMFGSLLFVILGTFAVLCFSLLERGWRGTRKRFSRSKPQKNGRAAAETTLDRQKRRVMAFAMPVALATWCVLLLFREQW